ncbi:ABC transporter ATP-binding protein [Rhodococcus sp. NPDC058521]|uniref:ABC transporter ATP-binding protein n=1 Tax=Rhodococcus sp. NPDC058521 TaxID=3346536 RepID=UPI003667B602
MIRIDDVRWSYAGAESATLDRLDLHIREGETVVLCGPSGSGKSTALRLMNGLVPHFHHGTLDGGVRVDGRSVAELPLDEIGRVTGTVLQHPRRQFFTDGVETELAFALENFGHQPARIRERVGAVVDEYGLDELTGRRLRDLSGGQQQLVAGAAASTHRPPVLLFDEPTSNLSAAAIESFAATVRRLRSEGATIVIAEHRLHFLRGIADRVLVLRDGRIATEWTGEQFTSLPESVLRAEGLRSITTPNRERARPAHARGASIESASPVPDSRPAGVILRDVRCSFRRRRVLEIAEAVLPAESITAITGPNGVGKSTLARILVGLQRHDGQVLLDGTRLSRARRLEESALVMQDVQRQLFTDSVDAELGLGACLTTDITASSLLSELGLGGLGDRHPLSLSGGQQQRLVVAAARLSGRRIVVFDEPSSGVDGRHLETITHVMRSIAEAGAVVVLISHDDELLAAAADRELRLQPLQ